VLPRPLAAGLFAMKMIANLFRSSLGKKFIMAVTGLILFGFVVGHLAGNLQIFFGPEAINRYGKFLHDNVELLWPVRIVLVTIASLHLWAAIKVSAENKAARPVAYADYKPVGSSYASRTMLMSGIILLTFLIYHLLHYTARVPAVNLTGKDFAKMVENGRADVFLMMITGFRQPLVSFFYVVGVGLVCLHLSHGASSMLQSLGWKNDAYRPILDRLARVVAFLIFLGYISIPVAVLFGFGKEYVK
jgi:succinate dehydrogenase / fumarate reductase, cytochrome b subunit